MNFLMKKKLSWNEAKRPEVNVLDYFGIRFPSFTGKRKKLLALVEKSVWEAGAFLFVRCLIRKSLVFIYKKMLLIVFLCDVCYNIYKYLKITKNNR